MKVKFEILLTENGITKLWKNINPQNTLGLDRQHHSKSS